MEHIIKQLICLEACEEILLESAESSSMEDKTPAGNRFLIESNKATAVQDTEELLKFFGGAGVSANVVVWVKKLFKGCQEKILDNLFFIRYYSKGDKNG